MKTRSSNRLTLAVVAALSVGGVHASAEASDRRENRIERVQDHRELRTDARETSDDRRDLRKMDQLLQVFDSARDRNDRWAMRRLDAELRTEVARELRESERELAQDFGEVRRDTREVRDERRETRTETRPVRNARGEIIGHETVTVPAGWTGSGDVRDDRRDRRDDVRDLKQERAQLERKRQISSELEGLYGRFERRNLDRKRALMVELAGMGVRELRENREEVREDRRELREDRRETREDRRR